MEGIDCGCSFPGSIGTAEGEHLILRLFHRKFFYRKDTLSGRRRECCPLFYIQLSKLSVPGVQISKVGSVSRLLPQDYCLRAGILVQKISVFPGVLSERFCQLGKGRAGCIISLRIVRRRLVDPRCLQDHSKSRDCKNKKYCDRKQKINSMALLG